jgi:ABC-type nitrate/sulfonate/bicarbonate transport system permease component
MIASTSPSHVHDRLRLWAHVLVTLVALLTGYVLGLLGGQPSGGSRAGWPPPPANPRSLNP